MESRPNETPRRRRWRRWLLALAAMLVASAVAAAWAVQAWLNSGPGRDWLLTRANAALAPAKLEVAAFHFSWFGPTRMTGFVLRDRQGEPVVSAPTAVWDRFLAQVLWDRPRYGTLRLERGRLDVEQLADGSVDLYEALRPVLNGPPHTSFVVAVRGGSLRLRSPRLAEPIAGGDLDLTLRRPAAPGPIRWDLTLREPEGGEEPGASLATSGTFERWKNDPDGSHPLDLKLTGDDWPLAIRAGDLEVSGRYDGTVGVSRAGGRWSSEGRATLDGALVVGEALAGDVLDLGKAAAAWDVAQAEAGVAIDRLDLETAFAALHAAGPLPAPEGRSCRIEGEVDLAAIAAQAPHALRLREGLTIDQGRARLVVEATAEGDRPAWDVRAELGDLVATQGDRAVRLEQPATLSAHLVGGRDDLAVGRLAIDSAFLKAEGSGDVDRGIEVAGTIDLDALRRQLADLIDLGDTPLEGTGRVAARYRREGETYQGSVTLDLDRLVVGEVAREAGARLDAHLAGPADAAGLPTGWSGGRVTLESGGLHAALDAKARDNDLAEIHAEAQAPLTLAETPGHAWARLHARRDGEAWAIDAAGLGLEPQDGRDGATLALAATGRFDPGAGTLDLAAATAEGPPGGPSLAPEGLHVVGLDGPHWRARGRVVGDVQALARWWAAWSGGEAAEVSGSVALLAEAAGGEGPLEFSGRLDLPDLSWPADDGPTGPGPIALDVAGSYREDSDELTLTELRLGSELAALEASGLVRDVRGRRVADLSGEFRPDWEKLTQRLAARVEPNARIEGGPRPFHLRGPLDLAADDPLAELDAEFGFDLTTLDVYGMRVGATPIVARLDDGRVAFEPIRTTLNDGALRLDPEIVRDEAGAWTFRLAPGSAVEGAEVNDEVSRRVLSYVAPVLDRATRVHGRVSAELTRAEVPLGPGAGEKAEVEGRVVFDAVEFAPGPLAVTIMGLIGREARTLYLDEPVLLTVADGRVHQRGLAVPVGNLTRIELAGSVGFDKSLDLVAGLPITRQMVLNNPLLGDVVEGTRISVPIGGTLADPEVDREAFQTAMRDLGKDLLTRGAARGAAELLFRLAQPRDPDRPRMTPRERRQLRRQKRGRP
jgi:translocation and assembly module TamB